ncbi:MAG: anthranilate synthase component I family protein [Candidatus Hodarchaeaceae archaeon]|nr:anthranilate synthase component I family protein [Candidatus Hodarchaeaceae archaeon]
MKGEKPSKPTPSIEEASQLADELGRPCLIPLAIAIGGCTDPAKTYLRIRRLHRSSYLLESAEGPQHAARYSVMGCDPLLYVAVRDCVLEVSGRPDVVELARSRAERVRHGSDSLEVLKEAMFLKSMQVPRILGPRYMLGAVGYISYDFIRSVVDLDNHAIDDLRHPDVEFMLPERAMIFDHLERRTYCYSLMLLTDGFDVRTAYERALANIKWLKAMKPTPRAEADSRITFKSNVEKADFERSAEVAKDYIRAGDIIQVVLSRRIRLEPAPPLGRFYMNLKRINPSPYMFFLDFPRRSIVGSSPEILVKVDGREVVTRPIAGTRRRGKDEQEDRALEQGLLADEKERAEHVMLVDLGRNDIGRVCEFGSVRLTEFMKIEKYGHVQHLVSTVAGRLREGEGELDALRATFPAGTVTGAPKVRAMEIIEELEPTRRGIYAGAIGSLNYAGQADLAITIRTLVAERGVGYIQVGAGIVADSTPWKEYYETENKARSLLAAAGV